MACSYHRDEAAAAEICGTLLAHGADAMAGAGEAGSTPLQAAVVSAGIAVVNVLLSRGPAARMLEAANSGGETALHYALIRNDESCTTHTPAQRAAVVQALLQAGAPVHAAKNSNRRETALDLACGNGFPECVPLLLAAGADPLRAAAESMLPVHAASATAAPDAWRALEPLVAAGGKAMLSISCAGGPPLHVAVVYGTIEAARELLRLGAPVNQLGSSSRGSALLCAYERGLPVQGTVHLVDAQRAGREVETYPPEDVVLPFVELLLAHGADPNLRIKVCRVAAEAKKTYTTPLIVAVFAGHTRVVAALLAAGADPDRAIRAGNPLLHAAVVERHLAVLQMLLPRVKLTDINDASSEWGSPLHIACHKGSLECVRALLAAGADPRVTWQGRTPSDMLAEQARGALAPAVRRRAELMAHALWTAKEKLQRQRGGAREPAGAGAAVLQGPSVPLPAAQVSAAAPPASTIAPAVKACCYCGMLEGACNAQAGVGTGMGMGGGSSSPAGAGPPAAVGAAQAPLVKLKRCAACAFSLYCSTACQRAHWRAGHKEECAAHVAREARAVERLTTLQQQQQQQAARR